MMISEILLKYDTDKNKGAVAPYRGHNYGNFYDNLFLKFDKNAEINILEIGVQKGGSLLAWKEYFPNANVYGIDISDSRSEKYKSDTVHYQICDLRHAMDKFGDVKFDIIIDDSDHAGETQAFIVKNYYSLLKPAGIMVFEDCQVPDEYIALVSEAMPARAILSTVDLRHIRGWNDDFIITVTTPEGKHLHEFIG